MTSMTSSPTNESLNGSPKWGSLLHQGFAEQLHSGDFADLKVVLGSGGIGSSALYLHQLVVGAASPTFLRPVLLDVRQNHGHDENFVTLILPDFEEEELETVVKYLYGLTEASEPPFTSDIVRELRLGHGTTNNRRGNVRQTTKVTRLRKKKVTKPQKKIENNTLILYEGKPSRKTTVNKKLVKDKKLENIIVPEEFNCEQCDEKFQSRSAYYYHLEKHKSSSSLECPQCHKCFKSRRGLKYHMDIHEGKLDHQCEDCGRGFVTRQKLVNHRRAKHTLDRPFTCENCGKGFTRSDKLTIHKRRAHTGEKPYSCSICDWKGVDSSSLIHHKKRHLILPPTVDKNQPLNNNQQTHNHPT